MSDIDLGGVPLVSLRGIVKRFGDFTANDHIDLDIRNGEVHALLGENGAGKSTLVKILYGLLEPSEGRIVFAGDDVVLKSPEQARALGIGMVFQHFSLFENLTVAENIALVLPKADKLTALPNRIAEIAARYGMALEADRPVWTLSAGERQRIEIARCLLQDPKLLILDEPTSVLTPQEAEALFATLDRLKAEGRALLYISHRLEEVKRLCDCATILRHGKVVATCDPKVESARSLAALMVGSQVKEVKPAGAHALGPERLVVQNLSVPSPDLHGTALRNICLAVHGGEVVGIAGVAGNGQSELFAALSGEVVAAEPDAIRINGAAAGIESITGRRERQAVFVPEERNGHAAAPDFTLSENVVLSRHATGRLTRGGFIVPAAAKALAGKIIAAFDVRKAGADPLARTLSGGNLQKFVVGREVLAEPNVLVVNQPTWGVDAAAAAAIRQAIIDLSARGAAVAVISQDLDELFEISDRIAVMHAGELSECRPAHTVTREEIGLLMTGGERAAGSAHAH
ncbi:MAG: ABC transporter ATP-binding protein [Methylobacteriaceae bacterium]|nr:ABC transporter ATP-binding protein [Methylobacteriaceae bacterium]